MTLKSITSQITYKSLWVWLAVAGVGLWFGWRIAKALMIVVVAALLAVLLVPSVRARYSRWVTGQAGLFDPLPTTAMGPVSHGGRS